MLNVKETNQKLKIPFLKNHEKISAKSLINEKIIFNVELPIEVDPIDSKRISKKPINCLTQNSVIKAGLVVLGMLGIHYLAKTTKIFSHFGRGEKNLKDRNNSEIMETKTVEDSLSVKTNSKTTEQVNNPLKNQITQNYRTKLKNLKIC
jgi:hypothetical protein